MKVHTAPARNPVADLCAAGATPVEKTPLKTIGTDAMLAASMLVNEAIALTISGSKPWNDLARRIALLSSDGRVAFIDLLKKAKRGMVKANAEVTASLGRDGKPAVSKDDTKMAGVLVSSATVYLSQLNGIADAFNNGATVEGFCVFLAERYNGKKCSLEDGTIATLNAYALTFRKSKTSTVKSFKERLAKFLEQNAPTEDDAEGLDLRTKVTALIAPEAAPF